MEISIILNNKVVKEFTGNDILKFTTKQIALTLIFMMIPKIVNAAGPVRVVYDEISNIMSVPEYNGTPLKCLFFMDFDCFKYVCKISIEAFKNDTNNIIRCYKIINGRYGLLSPVGRVRNVIYLKTFLRDWFGI